MNLDGIEDAVHRPTAAAGCAFGRLLQSLRPDERARLRAVVEDPTTSAPKLAEFLRGQGAHMTQPIVNSHRSGKCGCALVGWR